jgi:hypothetical protein
MKSVFEDIEGFFTMKKCTFFDFLNRYSDDDFESFLARSEEDVDYIDWNGYCLTMAYTDAAVEYHAVRTGCALFDASPVKKYRFSGADAGQFLDAVLTRRVKLPFVKYDRYSKTPTLQYSFLEEMPHGQYPCRRSLGIG